MKPWSPSEMDPSLAVLEVLYGGQGYLSLSELSRRTGLDTRSVSSALGELGKRGHKLEIRPAEGARLQRPARLCAHLIERDLPVRCIGRNVICFDQVDSTNDVAVDSVRSGRADGLVVTAEHQRRGRGRHGRSWHSAPGDGLLMSVVRTGPSTESIAQETLTLGAGLAVAEGIDAVARVRTTLKWPNDVLLDGRKIAGVLVEVKWPRRQRALVVGAGVNVNGAPGSETGIAATSLAEHLGGPVERIEVARAILQRMDYWLAGDGLEHRQMLHRKWVERCGMINLRATVVSGGKRYVGRVIDVDPIQGLSLVCDDGTRVHLPAEDSTVLQ